MNSDSLDHYLHAWELSEPQLLAETVTSKVYTVTSAGETVVLKLLKPYGWEESMGAAALRYFGGQGAVRLLREDGDAHLLEYADGPELASLVLNGQDEQAAVIIAQVLNQLHQPRPEPPPELRTLRRWFRSLFLKAEQDRQAGIDSVFVRTAALADRLLDEHHEECVLHGDIHHQNIRYRQDRGWLAFDPKGLYGERAYDAANTLRNPYMFDPVTDEARFIKVARILARELDIPLPRLLSFFLMYICLSASWLLESGGDSTIELHLAGLAETHLRG
jgi:streptomycin 6-kinase